MLDSLAKPGDSVTFEARVYIDGVLVACVLSPSRVYVEDCSKIP